MEQINYFLKINYVSVDHLLTSPASSPSGTGGWSTHSVAGSQCPPQRTSPGAPLRWTSMAVTLEERAIGATVDLTVPWSQGLKVS